MSRFARATLLCIAPLTATLAGAADGFYVGVSGGSVDLSWDPPTVAAPPVVPPPILYPVCGGTAVIQYGAGLDNHADFQEGGNSGLAPLFGWRMGRFALELSLPPELEATTTEITFAGEVTQPTCTTSPAIGVAAGMISTERFSVGSTTLAALYDIDLMPKLRLQLRAQATAWELQRDSSFVSFVVEMDMTTGLFTDVPLVTGNGSTQDDGVDMGYGIGLAVALREGFDLRLAYARQAMGDAEASGFTFGFVYGF